MRAVSYKTNLDRTIDLIGTWDYIGECSAEFRDFVRKSTVCRCAECGKWMVYNYRRRYHTCYECRERSSISQHLLYTKNPTGCTMQDPWD